MYESTVLDALIEVKPRPSKAFDQIRRVLTGDIGSLPLRVLAGWYTADSFIQLRTPVATVNDHSFPVFFPERLQQVYDQVLDRFHLLHAGIVRYFFSHSSIAAGKLFQFKILTDFHSLSSLYY